MGHAARSVILTGAAQQRNPAPANPAYAYGRWCCQWCCCAPLPAHLGAKTARAEEETTVPAYTIIPLDPDHVVAINEHRQIIGRVGERASPWASGTVINLDTLGGAKSEALALNVSGQVVGWAEDETGERRAFLWQRGEMLGLNTWLPPEAEWGIAREIGGINDAGQTIGYSIYQGSRRFFLLTPRHLVTRLGKVRLPQPGGGPAPDGPPNRAAWALAGSGLAATGISLLGLALRRGHSSGGNAS